MKEKEEEKGPKGWYKEIGKDIEKKNTINVEIKMQISKEKTDRNRLKVFIFCLISVRVSCNIVFYYLKIFKM